MKLPELLTALFRVPKLTRPRILLAVALAVMTDGTQLVLGLLGPLGWFLDEGIDVVATALTSAILGFHWLLLPTFVLKSVPLVDELPTWTACVAGVIALRKREQAGPP
jgi:hypothetical protein